MHEPGSAPTVPDDDAVPARFQVDMTGRTLLGTYQVERRLAEGGMGAVYLATDISLGRKVVVKVPHARFLGEPGFRARFRREVSELVRLEHPHVVRIQARGEVDDIPFFVLQYLGGGSLEDRLASGPQAPASLRGWLGPIAQTLDYVHAQGVVHRDVKPGNILFDLQGHPVLSDFGVVKALSSGEEGGDLTAAGTGVGSPFYMAPEQGLGRGVSPASDQYALASTVFEALAGEPPFGRGSAVQVLLRREREVAPSVLTRLPTLPAACADALDRALAKEPERRFASCREFAQALLAGLAPMAPSPPASPPLSTVPDRSHRPGSVVVALGLLALAGLGAWLLRSGGAEPSAPAVPPPRTRGADAPLVVLGSTGAEPRRALRFTLQPGTVVRSLLTTDQSIRGLQGTGPAGSDVPPIHSVREHPFEAEVLRREGDGRWVLALRFPPARTVPLEGGQGGDQREAEQALFDRLGALAGQAFVDEAGVLSDLRLEVPPQAAPMTYGVIEALSEQVRALAPVLPEEPLGVGAEWDVTSVSRVGGVRMQQTRTWKVLALDGPRVRLRFQVRQSAPVQEVASERGDKSPLTVREVSVAGEGEMLIDLGAPLVTSYEGRGSVRFSADRPGPDGAPLRMQFDTAFQGTVAPR